MFPPELMKRLEESYKAEGGGLFGLAGCPAMTYFAAHAPLRPDWYEPEVEGVEMLVGERTVEYELAAEALWRWSYARTMVKYKNYNERETKKQIPVPKPPTDVA